MEDEWLNNMIVCYFEWQVFETIDDETILVWFQNIQSRRFNSHLIEAVVSGIYILYFLKF